jgi:hypothetical protein
MENVQLQAQDIIDTLVSQRDAAFAEIVRQAAIIKALERKVREISPVPVVEQP